MNRAQRHGAILRLVAERPVGTQSELAEALRSQGHEVVQTTVSRDIHELGLIKIRHVSGRLVYAPPDAAEAGMNEALSVALGRWALNLEPSGNLVVVLTPHGYASALAEAIDVARHPHVAGTIAGENTVLLISREPMTGAQLVEDLQTQSIRGAA